MLGALGVWKAYFIEPLLFYIVFINVIKTKKQLHNIFWALGLSAIYLSLIAIWQLFSGWNMPTAFLNPDGSVDRVVSIFGYPNALGLYLGPIIILFTGFLFSKNPATSQKNYSKTSSKIPSFPTPSALGGKRGWGGFPKFISLKTSNLNFLNTILKLSIITLSFVVIILAQSEAAILSVVGIWFLWGLIHPLCHSHIDKDSIKYARCHPRLDLGSRISSKAFFNIKRNPFKNTRYYFLLLIILAVIAFLFIPQINSYLTEKLLLQDYSGFIRRLIWSETGKMLSDNWLLGAGLAGYQAKIAPYHLPTFEIFLYPHNIILNFWSELGILGMFSFFWLIILFLYKNLKAYLKNKTNLLNLTLLLITIQILVHGLVDAPYFKNDLSILFWIIIGIYVVNKNISTISS